MGEWWTTLPGALDPIAFSPGSFSVSWYALCYLFGAGAVVVFLFRSGERRTLLPERDAFWSLATSVLWGVLIGARLGYIVLYGDTLLFLREPWRIISPYDFETGLWIGIRGLSFYGGLVGGTLGLVLFARRTKLSFWPLSDWIVLALPLALFFGRIGNFLNLELFGRPTTLLWGMRFFPDDVLRHPSQLYEAFGEGIVLFLLLAFLARRARFPGFLTATFLFAYSSIRFALEFFREPDRFGVLSGHPLSANQILALLLMAIGIWLFQARKRSWYTTNTH